MAAAGAPVQAETMEDMLSGGGRWRLGWLSEVSG